MLSYFGLFYASVNYNNSNEACELSKVVNWVAIGSAMLLKSYDFLRADKLL